MGAGVVSLSVLAIDVLHVLLTAIYQDGPYRHLSSCLPRGDGVTYAVVSVYDWCLRISQLARSACDDMLAGREHREGRRSHEGQAGHRMRMLLWAGKLCGLFLSGGGV